MSLTMRGYDRGYALFTGKEVAAVVDTNALIALVATGVAAEEQLTARPWADYSGDEPAEFWAEVATAAILNAQADPGTELNASRRGYTVPKRAAAIAASAAASTSFGELGPEARAAAVLLASGGQVSLDQAMWVARFHLSNKQRGTKPAQWAAWGGTEGAMWALSLANKLGYDAVTASGEASLFCASDGTSCSFWTTRDAAGMASALWASAGRGAWKAWVNGAWTPDLGPGTGAVELDDQSATLLAAALLDSPDTEMCLREIDPHEWDLVNLGLPAVDWDLIERASLRAAGEPADGYTPEERSKNATGQLRDGNGRFAKVGDQGLMKSGLRGTIKTVNPQGGQLVIEAEDGNTYQIDAKDFEIDGGAGSTAPGSPDPSQVIKPLDLSGILGQPRASQNTPKAWLKNLLQPMGPKQLKQVVDDYEGYINDERQKRALDFKGGTGWREYKPPTPEEIRERKAHERNRDERLAEERAFYKKYSKPGMVAAGEPITEGESPADEPLTPDNSDVPPIYMAVVDREDTRAVLDLIALVPAGASDSTATTFKRAGGEWIEDASIMQDLKSTTPPPVVKLDDAEYPDILAQVDNQPDEPPADAEDAEPVTTAAVLTLVSAGGADRNRGGAEALRRYWTVGEGGLKIRWNTPGDWRRCVRLLSKHLGYGSKGYCALRHHEVTGMWPGDRRNRTDYSLAHGGYAEFSTDDVPAFDRVIRASAQFAAAQAAREKVLGLPYTPIPVTASDINEGRSGRAFKIPIVVPEGLSSGDKRHFLKGSLGIRTLPLPLLWQPFTGEGHDGSPIVGRIDHVERIPGGLGEAYGVFDTGPYGREAQRLCENGMLRWVSVDLDKFEVDEEGSEIDPEGKTRIKKGRMMAATLVSKPAFQECTLELLDIPEEEQPAMNELTPSAISASASIAEAIPVEPPSLWFDRPVLNGPTPIRVTDEGQVYGHIATWNMTHIGMAGQTRPPRSNTGYAYFHTGLLRTTEGTDVKVGQLTLAGGHADLHLNAASAAKHYDDTASAMADVHAGEDNYGIWVAGALRPGVTAAQIRALRASAPSGDWRWINGGHELVAVCQVNVPGFPVPQSLVAGGHMNAIVAAGVADLIAIRAQENMDEHQTIAAAARSRIYLALDVDGYLAEFKTFSPEKREELAKAGKALKDGSFPIENAADLRRAVHAYGRTTADKQASVRRHIVKRARALGKAELIPGDWREASLSADSLDRRERYDETVASIRAKKAQTLSDRINKPKLEAEALAASARIKSD